MSRCNALQLSTRLSEESVLGHIHGTSYCKEFS
ncbi:hypothetical protein A3Q41_00895 [Rhodococcoides fascians]|uniref:Uncharacterized protein n=1 Tax=Rhodococcoides fascians TaxID=1828 RepID=A0A143QGB8_RHOFA|nr:hypothetical protein A3Q41_00895 [Rhodococcus fascians]